MMNTLRSTNVEKVWSDLILGLDEVKFKTPKALVHEGTMITSTKDIANSLNEFYVDKIDKINKVSGIPL